MSTLDGQPAPMAAPNSSVLAPADIAQTPEVHHSLATDAKDGRLSDVADAASSETASLSSKKVPKQEVQPAGDETDDAQYPKGLRLYGIFVTLALLNILISLDQSIVAVIIPKVSDQFHDISDIGWYGSAYLLGLAATQILFGRLFTLLPVKSTYIAVLLLFELGSLICAVAPTSNAFIVGRAIGGIGGSGMLAGGWVIVAHTIPLKSRPLYAILDATTFGLGSALGPLIGGAITRTLVWRWCFYINLPIGGFAAIVGFFTIRQSKNLELEKRNWKQIFVRVDPLGTTFIAAAVICLLLAMQQAGTISPWDSSYVIGLLVGAGLLAVAFVSIQIYLGRKDDTLTLRVLSQRSIAAGSLFMFGLGAAFMMMLYYLSIWLQIVKSYSSYKAGIMLIPLMASCIISATIGGLVITRIGYYTPFVILSSIMMAVGAGLCISLDVDSSIGAWIGYQIIFGIGIGFGVDIPFVAAQVVLTLERVPSATSVLMFAQTLGASIFTNIGQTVYTNTLLADLGISSAETRASIVQNTGLTNLTALETYGSRDQVLHASAHALSKTFTVTTVLAAVTLIGALLIEHRTVKEEEESTEAATEGGGAEKQQSAATEAGATEKQSTEIGSGTANNKST